MTRDESLSIVEMVITYWRPKKDWTREEMDVYARMIQDMDAEITTHALIALAKETAYPPSISELREKVRAEKKKLAPTVDPVVHKPEPVPFWVKRWLCARMLYAQFNKPKDLRRFTEQGEFGDLTMEQMPEGAWVEEAESLSDDGMRAAWQRMFVSI